MTRAEADAIAKLIEATIAYALASCEVGSDGHLRSAPEERKEMEKAKRALYDTCLSDVYRGGL